jgi:CRP/FNR family cyclic AMP-dependent transcriptional regulator
MFTPTSEFGRIPDETKSALLAAVSRRAYANNEVVYLQDDEAGHLYFVVSGHVRLSYIMEDGSAVLFAILPPGESFGELGVFEGAAYCDMATAIGPCVVAGVPLKALRALGGRYPDINNALASLLARRYRSYINLTRNLSLKTLAARVAQSLLRLADELGTRTEFRGRDLPCVGTVVTQADLGLMARGARGNVNRALKTWERAGWIAIKDRSIVVIDRDKLENLSIEEDF